MLEIVLQIGFISILIVLMYMDYYDNIVDDRLIIVGILFVLPLQIILGRGCFAVKGAAMGLFMSGSLWLLSWLIYRVKINKKG